MGSGEFAGRASSSAWRGGDGDMWPSPVPGCHLSAPGVAAGGNDTPPFLPQVPHGDRMTH